MPSCASCHARMDPIGFALENYDGVGKWRAKDAGQDDRCVRQASRRNRVSRVWRGCGTLLLTKRRDEFIATVADRLLTYALGRGLEYYDRPAVRSIVRDATGSDPNAPAPSFER